jgi:hypothetical protein
MAQCSEEAKQFLESLLCLDFSQDSGERTFTAREGMRTVFTGIFSNVRSVTVGGQAVGYYPAFFDKRNGDYFNSIVLDKPVCGEVVIDADWGFDELPADLKKLLANAEAVTSQAYSTKEVKSKRVEDFQITYSDLSDDEVFLKQNAVTINKYSMCDVPYILHGETCHHGRVCGVC